VHVFDEMLNGAAGTETDAIVRLPVPTFVTVIVDSAEVMTVTLPKFTVVGDTSISGDNVPVPER
jgi:hypothetical protein